MAYYTGSANDMSALRSALVSACTTEGWSWDEGAEVLSKDKLFLRLQITDGYLTLLGRTSTTGGSAPHVARMGDFAEITMLWPVQYFIFVFEGEVYCVILYNLEYYQWCAFGASSVPVPGSGMWVGASVHGYSPHKLCIYTNGNDGVNPVNYTCPALFWRGRGGDTRQESWVHSDLDGQGWNWNHGGGDPPSAKTLNPLLSIQPNAWNSEAVLLPLRAYKVRESSKLSLTADLLHARCMRIKNYSPGEVITLGADRWMVFPFFKKDTVSPGGGENIDHSGTLGWAIRYEGP